MKKLAKLASVLLQTILIGCLVSPITSATPFSESSCCLDDIDFIDESSPNVANAPIREKSTHDDIWQRIRSQLTLRRDLHRSIVRSELDQLVQHLPSLFANLNKASPYLHFLVEEVEKRGFPIEIALLPFVESHFSPYAISTYGATGMWQFMPSTARNYDLQINWWYDGRRDVVESTRAALDYLEKLVRYFNGDWLLAISAYNAGPSRVKQQMKAFARRGFGQEYWALNLPRDTRRYVPMLLALCEIVQWGEVNGNPLPHIPNEPALNFVYLPGQMDLLKVAEFADMQIEELYRLNSGYKRWTLPPEGPFRIAIPSDKFDQFVQRSSAFSEHIIAWPAYRVRKGDSLLRIAELFEINPSDLRQVNNLMNEEVQLRIGNHLILPNSKTKIIPRGGLVRHNLKPGQTLSDISRIFGVELAMLEQQYRDTQLRAGVPISFKIGHALPSYIEGPKAANYTIRNGDTLSSIAARFGTTVSELLELNEMTSAVLYPGSDLSIPILLEP